MWICLRVLLRNSAKAEQDKIRNDILKLSAEERSTSTNTNSGGQQAPMSMAAHNTLMAMQQIDVQFLHVEPGIQLSARHGEDVVTKG